MVRSTQLVRVSDALPLAQSVDDDQYGVDLTRYKQQAKQIFRRLTPTSETRCTIESGPMALQYVIDLMQLSCPASPGRPMLCCLFDDCRPFLSSQTCV